MYGYAFTHDDFCITLWLYRTACMQYPAYLPNGTVLLCVCVKIPAVILFYYVNSSACCGFSWPSSSLYVNMAVCVHCICYEFFCVQCV